jgi:hypothetical protein
MLDATDTEAGRTGTSALRRVHVRRVEAQIIGTDSRRRTTPIVGERTRVSERTGSSMTVARSRIKSNRFISHKTALTFVGH